MRSLAIILATAMTASLTISCGKDGDNTAAGLPDGCEEVDKPEQKRVDLEAPPAGARASGTAVVETSCGSLSFALDGDGAPRTTASFAYLVDQGVYDNTPIHGIKPGFVIQAGDPLGDGTGGPGYFVDERPPEDTVYARGVVAMAKTSAEPPGRSGSQFFVVTAPADAGLPPEYALLGNVTSGFDTLERIDQLGQPNGDPEAPVVIERITLEAG